MAVRSRINGRDAVRPAGWNSDGVRSRKLKLEQFLSEHGIDICLLNETHLESGSSLKFLNYVCHRSEHPTLGGGKVISAVAKLIILARFGSAALGGYCRTLNVDDRTSEASVGVLFAHTTLDSVGADRVSDRRIFRLHGGWSQREAHGLEF
jgi:hypothetical protein